MRLYFNECTLAQCPKMTHRDAFGQLWAKNWQIWTKNMRQKLTFLDTNWILGTKVQSNDIKILIIVKAALLVLDSRSSRFSLCVEKWVVCGI